MKNRKLKILSMSTFASCHTKKLKNRKLQFGIFGIMIMIILVIGFIFNGGFDFVFAAEADEGMGPEGQEGGPAGVGPGNTGAQGGFGVDPGPFDPDDVGKLSPPGPFDPDDVGKLGNIPGVTVSTPPGKPGKPTDAQLAIEFGVQFGRLSVNNPENTPSENAAAAAAAVAENNEGVSVADVEAAAEADPEAAAAAAEGTIDGMAEEPPDSDEPTAPTPGLEDSPVGPPAPMDPNIDISPMTPEDTLGLGTGGEIPI